jgi:replicative DNA helicase
MMRLYRTQSPVDLATVAQYLKESDQLEEVGGASWLSRLIDSPTAVNLDYNVRKIKEKSALRETIELCNATMKRCYDDHGDADETIDFMQKKANDIGLYGGRSSLHDMKELVMTASDRYQRLAKNNGKISGVPTGFSYLDYLLGGLHPGLHVVAARPSMGKTSFATDILKNAARVGYGGLMFSMEQGEDEIIDRVIAGEAMVNLMKFRNGGFTEEDWKAVTNAEEKVYKWPIWIDPEGGLPVSELRRRARQYIRFHPEIKLIMIDYLQLMQGPKAENKNHEVGAITKALKALSKELKIPVLLLSQLNRMLENRPNPHKRPKLSDLRDSGNIEQDADSVIFIYRPEVYNDEVSTQFVGQADIDLSKHRNGPIGTFSTMFRVKHTRFYDVELTPNQEQPNDRYGKD